MKEILRANIDTFDSAGDSYYLTKKHQLREAISIKLLEDVIKGLQLPPQSF